MKEGHIAQFGNGDTCIRVYERGPTIFLTVNFNDDREEVCMGWMEALRMILRETEKTDDKAMYLEWVQGVEHE